MSTDNVLIVVYTVAACAAVGFLGAVVLRAARSRSLRIGIVVTALVPVAAVAAAVVVSVRAMFLSAHDSTVVLFALGVATVLAIALAVWAASMLTRGVRSVSAHVRVLDAPDRSGPTGTPTDVPAEFRRLADELDAARVRLTAAAARERALEQSRRELVAFLSHDLRTPLAGIRAIAEGLEDGVFTDEPAALAQLRVTVDRMAGLVDDLFELARLSGPPAAEQRALVSVTELVGDVVGEAGAQAARHGVAVDAEVPDGDRLAVRAAADEVVRALSNLVANAVDHTHPNGRVRVVAGRGEQGFVCVGVHDECGGIDETVAAHAFDVGWRSPDARGTGAGLGLAIARGVVEAHRGRISVRNVAGGCVFEIALPGIESADGDQAGVDPVRAAANAAMPSTNEVLARQPS